MTPLLVHRYRTQPHKYNLQFETLKQFDFVYQKNIQKVLALFAAEKVLGPYKIIFDQFDRKQGCQNAHLIHRPIDICATSPTPDKGEVVISVIGEVFR